MFDTVVVSIVIPMNCPLPSPAMIELSRPNATDSERMIRMYWSTHIGAKEKLNFTKSFGMRKYAVYFAVVRSVTLI